MNPFRQLKRYLLYKVKKKVNIDKVTKNFNNLNLDQIFNYFNCNKAVELKHGSGQGHGYSQFYDKHLNSFRNKKINILEIGSFAGASAASFSKYIPNSKIYCLDINLKNFSFTSKNIEVFGLDISKKKMIKNFYKNINIKKEEIFFDIIIDDGSHKLSDILISLNIFFKNLRPGGFYIVEEFKYPNFFEHLNDCNEIKIDELLINLREKRTFNSNIISQSNINYMLQNIKNIYEYKGLVKYSDIVFIEKLN